MSIALIEKVLYTAKRTPQADVMEEPRALPVHWRTRF